MPVGPHQIMSSDQARRNSSSRGNPLSQFPRSPIMPLIAAKVAPNPGTQFGTGGEGHMRFNLALPRPTLLDAIGRIERAFTDIQ